jgi:hypothetical protein
MQRDYLEKYMYATAVQFSPHVVNKIKRQLQTWEAKLIRHVTKERKKERMRYASLSQLRSSGFASRTVNNAYPM